MTLYRCSMSHYIICFTIITLGKNQTSLSMFKVGTVHKSIKSKFGLQRWYVGTRCCHREALQSTCWVTWLYHVRFLVFAIQQFLALLFIFCSKIINFILLLINDKHSLIVLKCLRILTFTFLTKLNMGVVLFLIFLKPLQHRGHEFLYKINCYSDEHQLI